MPRRTVARLIDRVYEVTVRSTSWSILKERPGPELTHAVGWIFTFIRKKLAGSYLFLSATSRP
jgi:hypothetical protein